MIFTNINDDIQNKSLSLKIQKCLEFTKNNNLEKYKAGTYNIENTDIKFNIDSYNTKPESECKWESHLRYVDVQIMLKGKEYIAINNIKNLKQLKIENDKDFIGYIGDKLFQVLIEENDVLVLYPNDAHMPTINVNGSISVKKVVFKVDLKTI